MTTIQITNGTLSASCTLFAPRHFRVSLTDSSKSKAAPLVFALTTDGVATSFAGETDASKFEPAQYAWIAEALRALFAGANP